MSEITQHFHRLDKRDLQILYQLDRNARMSTAAIAQTLDMPEATIRYRLQAMLTNGTITTSYPVFGVGRVGMSVHKFMFKLQKATEQEISRFVNHLVQHSLVNWVARFDGNFDAGCTLSVKDVGQVSQFLDTTRKRFHLNVRQMAYAVNIHAEFFARDYLVHKHRAANSKVATYTSYSEVQVNLDKLDWDILRAVTNNVRTPATEIASALKCSSETVGRRLKALEKQQIITGYRLVLEPNAVGRTSYYMLMYLHFVSDERLNKMLNYLRSHPAVVYLIKMLGEWDYDISLEVKDATEYRNFMIELMQEYSDVIKDVQTLTTWHVAKFSILPKN